VKVVLYIARAISAAFRPFYLPLLGVAALFLFSILNVWPLVARIRVLLLIWISTVLLPQFLISIYHKTHGLKFLPFVGKEHRIVPYMISIVCYSLCYWILVQFNSPHMIKSVVIAALVVQMVCALINIKWKISTHSAAIGSFLGGLIAFSCIFYFNPIWWFCVVNLIGGVVGSCRMILRQHTLGEVIGGYCVGFFGALITILFV